MAASVLTNPRMGSWLSSLVHGCGIAGCGGPGISNEALEGQVSAAVLNNLSQNSMKARDPLNISSLIHSTMSADATSYQKVQIDPAYTLALVQSIIQHLRDANQLLTLGDVAVPPVGSTAVVTATTPTVTVPQSNNNVLLYAGLGLGALSLIMSMRKH